MRLLTPLLLAYIFTINLYADKNYYDKIASEPLTCAEQMDVRRDFTVRAFSYKRDPRTYNSSTLRFEKMKRPQIYLLNNRNIAFEWDFRRVSLYPQIVNRIYYPHIVDGVMNCKYKIATFQQRGHTVYIISDKD